MSFWQKLRHSSSYQVGLLFASLMLLGVLFVSYWLVLASNNTLLRESEAAVRAELRGFIEAHELAGARGVDSTLSARMEGPGSGFFYALRQGPDSSIAGNINVWPESDVERLREGLILFEIPHGTLPGVPSSVRLGSEHFDIMAKIHRFDDGREILVGRDVDDLEIAQFVTRAFGWTMILILVSIFLLSFGVAYYVASRFERIAATTDRIIATGNLSERLSVDSSWDDLSKLAALLNRMLAEIETRVDGIKSVSDSIAHDLRTPLMRLRTRIETEVEGDVREDLLAELERILAIFNGLLRISSIEAGKQQLALSAIEPHTLLEDAVALYEPLAGEAGLNLSNIEVHGPHTSALLDRDLVFQALANLVDNAIKFTPEGGSIRVQCHYHSNFHSDYHSDFRSEYESHSPTYRHTQGGYQTGDHREYLGHHDHRRSQRRGQSGGLKTGQPVVRLVVADTGPGIGEQHREQALARFGRLDDSRSTPGNGLGLPLVAAIARRHGGDVVLSATRDDSTLPGLTVTLLLPLNLEVAEADSP